MRAFLAAIDRTQRDALAADFAVMLTAGRGDAPEIKAFLRRLDR